MITIAVIDDEKTARNMMARALTHAGYTVETFAAGAPFLKRIQSGPFDIVFLDLMLPDMNGMDILNHVKTLYDNTEVIIVTGHSSIENAVEATKQGAFHYLPKPCRRYDLCLMAERAAEKTALCRENRLLKTKVEEGAILPGFIGNSKAIRSVFETIAKVAMVNCNVLIEAETGTGKQLTSRAIHQLGPRKKAPFVYFNCGSFTDDLICNELFGHEKGSFTGATDRKIGLFESAAGGTVLLDEIGEMPLSMQVKLLHVLQERQIFRIGSNTPIDLDIRIIAATNQDLKQLVGKRQFREDLYYRLNVVTIKLPRLDERKEDIPLLVHHFIKKANHAFSRNITGISSHALDLLMNYHFPGNVRELENIVEHAVALTDTDKLLPKDFPAHLRKLKWQDYLGEELISLEEIEKRYISRVLTKTEYNIKSACRVLKMSRTTLWRRIKKYGISNAVDLG